MNISIGTLVTNKVEIGNAPIGTVFIVRTYGQTTNSNYINVFQYGVVSREEINGNIIGFSDEFHTETEMHTEFLDMFNQADSL